MKVNYIVEILSEGKEIEGFGYSNSVFSVDKENFNDMLLLVDFITTAMTELDSVIDEKVGNVPLVTLRIYSEGHVLFESLKAFNDYLQEKHIQSWVDSSFKTYITVNGIKYQGEVEKGMVTSGMDEKQVVHKMYKVLLASCGNVDYGENPFRPVPGIKDGWEKCNSIEECQQAVRAYIEENNLGGGQWNGGKVLKSDVEIGHISYNGRFWDKE
ncbi:hypothetical protein [Peribacillus asahii]|uniref:hypothetical protein n=1 Tax=Peribacillus asahii TaxID=228899 RepID=UPI00207986F3|nr:hypothetical protein [Peribacillus asahii]USK62250.1 hypothetical protein LIT37_24050 [Peribacillus asahii]